jgi:hypothetical protein
MCELIVIVVHRAALFSHRHSIQHNAHYHAPHVQGLILWDVLQRSTSTHPCAVGHSRHASHLHPRGMPLYSIVRYTSQDTSLRNLDWSVLVGNLFDGWSPQHQHFHRQHSEVGPLFSCVRIRSSTGLPLMFRSDGNGLSYG